MPSVELTLNSLYSQLSMVERRLADFILASPERIPGLSVRQIASGASASVAAVSRLVRKAGYAGLRDFKLELARERAVPPAYFYKAIEAEDSDAELVTKVFLGNRQSLEDTLKLLDPAALAQAVRRMVRARALLFFGVGSSGILARDAAMRFSLLGLPARALSDPSEVFFRAATARQNEVAVGLSHSGRSLATVHALELAREGQALTIGISNYLRSPLHAASDFFFCTSFPETRVTVTALSSRVAQLCLIDAMYLLAARLRGAPRDYEQVNRRMEKLLRLPERS
jgi:RpiR family carbohydrate utilization transcriptional regulator